MPALRAFLPETVPPSALAGANSLFQGTGTAAADAGPAPDAPRLGMPHDAKEGLRVVARAPWL